MPFEQKDLDQIGAILSKAAVFPSPEDVDVLSSSADALDDPHPAEIGDMTGDMSLLLDPEFPGQEGAFRRGDEIPLLKKLIDLGNRMATGPAAPDISPERVFGKSREAC
jgi:hypothetical protein